MLRAKLHKTVERVYFSSLQNSQGSTGFGVVVGIPPAQQKSAVHFCPKIRTHSPFK